VKSARLVRVRTVLAGLFLGLFTVLIAAGPASAHAVLVGASPARGSVVDTAPAQIVLTFSEAVKPVQGRTKVIAPDGSRIDQGDPRSSGVQLLISLKQTSMTGTYLVSYRILSSDSHPVGGAYTYSVGAPSPGGPPSLNNEPDAASTPITVVYSLGAARWIGYAGLVVLVGSALILAMLWPARLDRAGPARFIWIGAALVAFATLAELALEIPYVGGSFSGIRSADVKEVLSSEYGAAHLIRLGVLAVSLLLLRPILRGKGWGADRVLLAVLGTIGVATWSVSGHPGSSPVPMVTIVADMIHIASMSIWLGGLLMLIVFLLPRANPTELSAIVPVWSRWALYAVGALIATGVAQALVEVGSVAGFYQTSYGREVLIKSGLVLVVLAIAWQSRQLVKPIAAGDASAARLLRMRVGAEATVAVVILGVASALVQTTPARSIATAQSPPTIQSAIMRDNLFTLTIDVQPAQIGLNDIHLYATTPDGQPADIKQWEVKASLPSQGIEPISAVVLPITPDHSTGQIGLPTAGLWKFTFTLRTSDVDQSSVTTDIVVRE
jgi:copper transport protein